MRSHDRPRGARYAVAYTSTGSPLGSRHAPRRDTAHRCADAPWPGAASLASRMGTPRPSGFTVRARIEAEGDVITNRAGLVALLPTATFAGARFTVRERSGRQRSGQLARSIAPHQPLHDLGAVTFVTPSGLALRIATEGDEFEIEDQRNWLDPSYKLYSRTLSRPVPYRIADGEIVEQHIIVEKLLSSPRRAHPGPHRVRTGRIPALGVAAVRGRVPRHPKAVAQIASTRPAFVQHATDESRAICRWPHRSRPRSAPRCRSR